MNKWLQILKIDKHLEEGQVTVAHKINEFKRNQLVTSICHKNNIYAHFFLKMQTFLQK